MQAAITSAFIASQHCIVLPNRQVKFAPDEGLQDLCLATFNIQPAITRCSSSTTLDHFNKAVCQFESQSGIRDADSSLDTAYADRSLSEDSAIAHKSTPDGSTSGIRQIVVTIDLDLAPAEVQIQVIELLRTGRIFTKSAMQRVPKRFLFIATMSSPQARLQRHLNDLFAISHHVSDHDSSVKLQRPFSEPEMDSLRSAAGAVNLTAELDSYLHHIVIFMRNDRYVQGGVTAMATRHFRAISKALAALQGFEFVTPTVVMQAARMVYRHRLVLATAETEKTLQWGSDQQAIAHMLEGVQVKEVIDDVIASVPAPL